ncbi:MAG: hypothetical protein WCG23_08245 [bacterium]
MQKKNCFFQEFFKSNASVAIEDYRDLKENVSNTEFSLSKPKVAYQYAEIMVKSSK